MNRFPASVAEDLGHYVYIYTDPRDNSVFYVGKGRGNRVFDHLAEEGEKPKHERIREIHEAKKRPVLEILAHGLNDEQAKIVEAAVIDLLRGNELTHKQLTNQVGGWGSREYGRYTVEEISALYCKTPAKIRESDAVILIRINQLFYSGMTPQELYEATRGIWVLNPNLHETQYAFAVFDGVVREVYEIAQWFPAGTTAYFTREVEPVEGRWEFVGRIADEITRKRYVLKSVSEFFPHGTANPIRYVNCRR